MKRLIAAIILFLLSLHASGQGNPIYTGPLNSLVSFPVVYLGKSMRVTGLQLRDSLGSAGWNFANHNLTFSGNRTHYMAGYSLQIREGSNITLNAAEIDLVGGKSLHIGDDGMRLSLSPLGYYVQLDGDSLTATRSQHLADREGTLIVSSDEVPAMVLDGSDSVTAILDPGSKDDYGSVTLHNNGASANFKKVVLVFSQPYNSTAIPVISTSLQGGVYYLFANETDNTGFAFAVPAVPAGADIRIYYQVKGK